MACHAGWRVRRVQGKLMSVLRLLKALFTFVGGLDYVAWKMQRHSGRQVEIPARVRRWPWIFMWGYFWGLYRQGDSAGAIESFRLALEANPFSVDAQYALEFMGASP